MEGGRHAHNECMHEYHTHMLSCIAFSPQVDSLANSSTLAVFLRGDPGLGLDHGIQGALRGYGGVSTI